MTSISDVIGHYQRSIDKSAHDEARLLHCIEKLYKLPITVEHLQQTGIGKTVNSLRKYDKEVGVAAKTLVAKWKAMVAAEEEIVDDDDDGDGHKSSEDEDDAGDDSTDKPNGHSYDRHSDRNESPPKRHDKSSSANSETKERKYKEEHSRHSSSHSSDRHSRDKSSNNGTSSNSNKPPKEVDRHRSNGKLHGDRRRNEDSNNSGNSSNRKSRQPSPHDSDDHSLSDDDEDEDEEKLIIDTEKEIEKKIEQSIKQLASRNSPKSSSHHKSSSSKNSSSRSGDHHKHDREKEKDKKESSKKSSSSSSSSKSSSSSSSHDKSDKDKHDDRHRHKSDRKDEEKSSRINGDHKSSSSSSTSSRSSSKHHDKPKGSDKTSKDSSKSSASSKDKDKQSSSKESDRSSSKRKHEHTESSNSDDEQNAPKKTKTKTVLEGIDSSAGMFSFEEALGMMAPPSKPTVAKSKSAKLNGSLSSSSSSSVSSTSSSTSTSSKSTPSRSGSSPSGSRSKTPPLLTPKVRLAPLDPKLSLELPTISNNYKPLPLNPTVMDCVFSSSASALKTTPQKRTMSDADALQSGIQSKTIRTKIYSGVRTGQIHQVTSLYQLCIRVLQKNIDALEYTGDVPYDILKPVLELATPQQLQLFEEYNPYILVDTDELWEKHCYRRYKAQKREEMESWREMFVRCKEIEAQRLSVLTKNIIIQQKQITAPVRRTQLAYVDVDVKPPRNVQRKQEQYGTKGKMIATPAARVEALSKITPSAAKIGDTRLRVAAADTRDFAQASSNNRPKKAPLMQKTLQLMRGRFKR